MVGGRISGLQVHKLRTALKLQAAAEDKAGKAVHMPTRYNQDVGSDTESEAEETLRLMRLDAVLDALLVLMADSLTRGIFAVLLLTLPG